MGLQARSQAHAVPTAPNTSPAPFYLESGPLENSAPKGALCPPYRGPPAPPRGGVASADPLRPTSSHPVPQFPPETSAPPPGPAAASRRSYEGRAPLGPHPPGTRPKPLERCLPPLQGCAERRGGPGNAEAPPRPPPPCPAPRSLPSRPGLARRRHVGSVRSSPRLQAADGATSLPARRHIPGSPPSSSTAHIRATLTSPPSRL